MRETLKAFEKLLGESASEILLNIEKHKIGEMDLDQYVPWLESTIARIEEISESIEDLLEKDLAGAWDLWVGLLECELSAEEALRSSRTGIYAIH
jgi:hypothetical protein